ncbi:MAG: hypothetical protein AAGI15_08060 [Pseudomonadota bacterium]
MNDLSRESGVRVFPEAPQAFMSQGATEASVQVIQNPNPNEVKQREHVGIGAIVSGAFCVLVGICLVFISVPWAAATIGFGVVALVGGGVVLTSIPELLSAPSNDPF